MPNFYVEGNTAKASDDAMRSLHKLVSQGPGTGGSGSGEAGAGSPEGAVTADPGTTYLNTSDNSFWAKATGVGTNTGWVQLLGP